MLVPGPFPPSPPKTVKLGPYQIRRRWWRWRRGRNLLFLRGRAMAIAPFQNRKPHCCYWAAGHGLLLLFVRFIFPCFIAPLFLLLLLLLPVLSSRAENHTENTHTHILSRSGRPYISIDLYQGPTSFVGGDSCWVPDMVLASTRLTLSVIYVQLPPSQSPLKSQDCSIT